MDRPETRYASIGDTNVAYQVVGDGPIDIVWMTSWFGHVEAYWEHPPSERLFRRVASFGRVILFDRRGIGLSDPVPLTALPTLEEWMDDLLAVLNAVGSQRVALVIGGDAGPMGILFAATYPDRTAALVLAGCFARFARAPDYPIGAPPEWVGNAADWIRTHWGTVELARQIMPSADDEYLANSARFMRLAASPGTAAVMLPMLLSLDVRHLLPAIQAPTLVLHRNGDRYIRVEHGRYLAEHIAGAKLVEFPGDVSLFGANDDEPIVAAIEEFLTGAPPPVESDRVLATVMFTDIVDSTRRAAEVGDRRWREMLDAHDAAVDRQLQRHRGLRIKSTGDGILATFDGPARAILCASAIQQAVRSLGIEVRAGLHTGEVELRGDDIGGVAVHIAARVAGLAGSGEILVSRTVTDLVAGSGLRFADRGICALRGVPGEWNLFAVEV